MLKILYILIFICSLLTIIGMIYVLLNHGEVNAGVAIIPMVLTIVFWGILREHKKAALESSVDDKKMGD